MLPTQAVSASTYAESKNASRNRASTGTTFDGLPRPWPDLNEVACGEVPPSAVVPGPRTRTSVRRILIHQGAFEEGGVELDRLFRWLRGRTRILSRTRDFCRRR